METKFSNREFWHILVILVNTELIGWYYTNDPIDLVTRKLFSFGRCCSQHPPTHQPNHLLKTSDWSKGKPSQVTLHVVIHLLIGETARPISKDATKNGGHKRLVNETETCNPLILTVRPRPRFIAPWSQKQDWDNTVSNSRPIKTKILVVSKTKPRILYETKMNLRLLPISV